jgi:hypothetical protein
VTKFFEGPEFRNQPKAIAEYCEWAKTLDGPAMYGQPTPQFNTIDENEPGYPVSILRMTLDEANSLISFVQEPDDQFLSAFIIDTLSPLVKPISKSILQLGHPVGALALTLAAVSSQMTLL